MKRIDQLLPLSKEHHQSLVLAKKCKDIIARESEEVIKIFALQLEVDFDMQWAKHFKIEEQTIFSLAAGKSKEMSEMCVQLSNEHQIMEKMVRRIAAGDHQLLAEFGQLLHDHTRLEERQLFPLIEKQFTGEELDNILEQS